MSDERSELFNQLKLAREHLRFLREQRASLRDSILPFHIKQEIITIQRQLVELKQRLNELGITIEDLPDELPRDNKPIACPYPGMHPFSEQEASRFYGRSKEIERLRQALSYQHLFVVIGPSGSGKSSMIMAGLLPELAKREAGAWLIRQMRPGTTPLITLQQLLSIEQSEQETIDYAQAVAKLLEEGQARRCLIVIDQFEELFAQTAPDEQKAFITVVLELSKIPDCVLILNLRADFYQDFLESKLWPITESQRLEIGPLQGSDLRSAIEQPALDVGVELEPALVERLLADVADEPGVLPLLQETLVLLWKRMDNQNLELRLQDYERLGNKTKTGLHVAIALLADKALTKLTEGGRQIAQRIFVRLVQFGQGRPHTRRQQTIADLRAANDDTATFDQTLRTLVTHRLVTVDRNLEAEDAVIDLAHEALITAWPTFKDWLKEYQIAEQFRRRLQDKQQEWQERQVGGRSGGLLDQDELQDAQQWLASDAAQILGYDAELLNFIKQSELAINPGWNRIGLITLVAAALGLTASIGWLIFGLTTSNLPERFGQAAVLIILICIALFLLGLWFLLRRSEAYQLQRLSQIVRRRPLSLTGLTSFFLLAIVLWSTPGWRWLQSEQRCRELGFRHNTNTLLVTVFYDNQSTDINQTSFIINAFADMLEIFDPLIDVHVLLDVNKFQECENFIDYRVDIIYEDQGLYSLFMLRLFNGNNEILKNSSAREATRCEYIAKLANMVAETLNYYNKEEFYLIDNTECKNSYILDKADEYIRHEKYDKAEAIYRDVLMDYPGSIRARISLADLMNRTGRYDEVIHLLQDVFPRNIQFDLSIQSQLLIACNMAEKYDCAEEVAKNIIDSGEDPLYGYISIISVYRAKKQYSSAEKYIREAEKVLEELDPASDSYNEYKYMIIKEKGVILFIRQHYLEAQVLFNQVLSESHALGIKEEVLYYQARLKEEEKDLDVACKAYKYHIDYSRLNAIVPTAVKRLQFSEERLVALGCR